MEFGFMSADFKRAATDTIERGVAPTGQKPILPARLNNM
jgi:hypothetical protein